MSPYTSTSGKGKGKAPVDDSPDSAPQGAQWPLQSMTTPLTEYTPEYQHFSVLPGNGNSFSGNPAGFNGRHPSAGVPAAYNVCLPPAVDAHQYGMGPMVMFVPSQETLIRQMSTCYPEYPVLSAPMPNLEIFDVTGYFSTSAKVHVPTRYLEVKAPGACDLSSIIKQDIDFHMAVPLSAGKENPEYPKRIRFDDSRVASESFLKLTSIGFDVAHIKNLDYAMFKYDSVDISKRHEGQLSVWLEYSGNVSRYELQASGAMRGFVLEAMGQYGDVRDAHADAWYLNGVRYRVEYYSLVDCLRALKLIDCQIRGLIAGFDTAFTVQSGYSWRMVSVHSFVEPTPDVLISTFPGPAPFALMNNGPILGLGVPPPLDYAQPLPERGRETLTNRVTLERIHSGADVRTTIMLRNIPNRMDWLCLKALLDTFCFGQYDFMYLRIDFKTCSNVGYAFINFTSASALIPAIEFIEHRRWPGYQSSKPAEISYATIQGKEALIQKFRNSSVMRESPYCRPRMFISWEDTNHNMPARFVGTETAFPEPDNLAKLHRSMENARNIGLYPPQHSNHVHGHHHRSRHSMYDRGTPRDQLQSAAEHTLSGRGSSRRSNYGFRYALDRNRGQWGYGPIERPAPGTFVQHPTIEEEPEDEMELPESSKAAAARGNMDKYFQ